MVTQGALVADLRRVAERERTRLLEKTKDKKILQTLREQRHDAFTRAAATADQAETDEINARRFDRATAPRETTS
jgi:flagellar export protein FliJ